MSEAIGHSRLRHFLMMLPFFIIGIAIPYYFFGFSGDGPFKFPDNSYHPPTTTMAPAPAPGSDGYSPGGYPGSPDYGQEGTGRSSSIVSFARGMFESVVDSYVSPNLSPMTIKIGFLIMLFVGGYIILRLLMLVVFGGILSFLIHKAAGPMFMGFMAVGSTWGIHQTIADQYGMEWAATTVSLTAAVATLFALAGIKFR
jgi:hypothetical protein